MSEQAPQPEYGSFSKQPVGTVIEHGHRIDLHASELAQLKAREDIELATNPQLAERVVQERLEHPRVFLPQEMIHQMGVNVVRGLRNPHSENSIDLFNNDLTPAPYIHSPAEERAVQETTAHVYQFPVNDNLGRQKETSDVVRVDVA